MWTWDSCSNIHEACLLEPLKRVLEGRRWYRTQSDSMLWMSHQEYIIHFGLLQTSMGNIIEHKGRIKVYVAAHSLSTQGNRQVHKLCSQKPVASVYYKEYLYRIPHEYANCSAAGAKIVEMCIEDCLVIVLYFSARYALQPFLLAFMTINYALRLLFNFGAHIVLHRHLSS